MNRREVLKSLKIASIGLMVLSILLLMLIATRYKPVIIISSSMEPKYMTNSIVIIDTKTQFKDLRVGDVINYSHNEHKGIVHRVFQVSEVSNTLLTGGINRGSNPLIDSWVVSEGMYKGKVVRGFNWVAPIITFLFGNLVDKNPTHIGFGFTILTLLNISFILILIKIKKGVIKMLNRKATDVYMITEHRKDRKRVKVTFKGVLEKVLISTIVLSALVTSAGNVYATTSIENTVQYNSSATITQNYDLSVEGRVFEVKQTIKAIEDMKTRGLVSSEVLSELANELMSLEQAVQLSGKGTTQEVADTVLKVEDTIKGVKGAETVSTVLTVVKQSLNINPKVEMQITNKTSKVKLSDISNHWGKSNIERLVGMKAISGYPDGTFQPNRTISFAEFLKIAVSSVEKNVKSSPKGSHWASGVYSTAIEKGIIKSSEFSGSKERFDSTISREDMALILVRLNEISQGNESVDTSKTKNMIQDYKKIADNRTYYVEQAYQKGLLNGKDNGFDPKGNLTRAEAATAVINLLDYKRGTVVKAPVTGTEKAKEVFNQIPTYNQKTNHGLKFEGVGYTLDDVAVFAKSYLSVFLNYDATDISSMDTWEKEVLGYMTTGSVESIVNLKQELISTKDKCKADIYVDASKIEIRDGRFYVNSVFYDYVSGKTFKAEIRIGGHNVNKSEIAVGYYNIAEVK